MKKGILRNHPPNTSFKFRFVSTPKLPFPLLRSWHSNTWSAKKAAGCVEGYTELKLQVFVWIVSDEENI